MTAMNQIMATLKPVGIDARGPSIHVQVNVVGGVTAGPNALGHLIRAHRHVVQTL